MFNRCHLTFGLVLTVLGLVSSLSSNGRLNLSRRTFCHETILGPSTFSFLANPNSANAMTNGGRKNESILRMKDSTLEKSEIAYKTLLLDTAKFNTKIPVACWFPVSKASVPDVAFRSRPMYKHRISVKRIGELLAGWDFIPEFASRDFSFKPTTPNESVLNGEYIPFPSEAKVIILAHGFLGSRFDLSHIAEELASQGYICLSPEYPESLTASYTRVDGMDREFINNALINFIKEEAHPSGYGVVGHSLGCGAALTLGDSSWVRVLIAGPPAPKDCPSSLLFITSLNDVFVRSRGSLALPSLYERLEENVIPIPFPKRSALIFDRPNAPTHISYLSENVNNAMVSFLSPLLPVAQVLSIPVLDFDKYKEARDAKPTSAIILPLISEFFIQNLGK